MTSELAPELAVCDRWDEDKATVTVQGEIDLCTVEAFSEHLGDVVRHNPQQLVIDLAGVSFIDSSGLHAFVRARRDLPEDCPIVLRSPRRQVRQVFEVTGLAMVFAFE